MKHLQPNQIFMYAFRGKPTALILMLFFAVSLSGQVVINEIFPAMNEIELKNLGDEAEPVGDLFLCNFPAYVLISDLSEDCGSFMLPPGELLTITANFNVAADDGEMGLYLNTNWSDPDAIIDYVEWGSTGHQRASVADAAGIWDATAAVDGFGNSSSLEYGGSGDEVSSWMEASSPTICSENSFSNESSSLTIEIVDDPTLGQILTDGDGFTLYCFTLDAAPNTSFCDGPCQDAWPVVYGEELTLGSGLDAEDFGEFVRADGELQSTYKGWPLYYWFQDTMPGMMAGEAVNEVWFVAKPDYSIMLLNDQLTGADGVDYTSEYVPGAEVVQYFVDAYGRSIYTFIVDNFNQNNFSEDGNFDERNEIWPIYEETMGAFASTLDESLFDVIEVAGRNQLTYKGWPLYYWQGDMERGDNFGVSIPDPGVWPVAVADLETAPVDTTCEVEGGMLTTVDGGTDFTLCAGDGVFDSVFTEITGAVGDTVQWIITEEDGTIIGLPSTTEMVNFEDAGAGVCHIYSVSYDGELTGLEVDSNIANLDGCFALSNRINVYRVIDAGCSDLGSSLTVEIVDDPTLGQILTDGDGFTLYYFTLDAVPNTSFCDGGCQDAWPVVYGDELTLGSGLDAEDFGQFIRADGELQRTYKGWPLYYWFQDTMPGMTAGEAVNDVWFVAKPDYSIMLLNDQLTGADGVDYTGEYVPGTEVVQYFVDAYGRSIYTFIVDNFNQNNFSENGNFDERNEIWPIYEETMGAFASTLDESLFDVIEVAGRNQLTYKGWPLYYWQGDMERGDNFGVSIPDPGVWPVAVADLETAPVDTTCEVEGGMLTTLDGGTDFTLCAGDGVFDSVFTEITGAEGDTVQWIITEEDGTIIGLPSTTEMVNFEDAGAGVCHIYSVSYEGELTGLEVDSNITNLDGCFALSNRINVYRVVDAACGDLGSSLTVEIVDDPTLGQILTDGDGFTLYYFTLDAVPNTSFCDGGCQDAWPVVYGDELTLGSGLDAEDFGQFIRADGELQRTYKGWPLYYWFQDTMPGMTAGEAVNDVWFVAKPDYSIMLLNDQLTGADGVDYTGEYVPGTEVVQYFVDAYGRSIYTFIVDNFNQNNFSEDGNFDERNEIWPIYEETMGAFASTLDESLFDVIEVAGRNQLTYKGWPLYYWRGDMERGDNFGVSVPDPGVWPIAVADLDFAPVDTSCQVEGGMLTTADGDSMLTICAGDGVSDAFDVNLTDTVGSQTAWVITDDQGEILALPMAPPFDLEGAGSGLCLVWHVSYEDTLMGAEIGNNAADLEGCFDLSNPIYVQRNDPEGGMLTTADGDTMLTICADDTLSDAFDVILTDESGMNTQWVITDDQGEILGLPMAPPFDLEGAGPGLCLVWHLSYYGDLTGAEVGNNASDLEGCFELSNPIYVTRLTGEDCVTSTDEVSNLEAFEIFPNPVVASSEFVVRIKGLGQEATLTITSAMGQVHHTEQLAIGQSDVTILTDAMAGGLYLVSVRSRNFVESKRVIIQK